MSTATETPADASLATSPPPAALSVDQVPISDLRTSPLNPRKHFGDLAELAQNIAARGVIVPLIARHRRGTAKGVDLSYLEIVDGERRFRAAKDAGALLLPVIRRDELTDAEVLEIQLISAIQRSDLTPLEEARGYEALIKSNPARYSIAYIADRISRSEKYVADRMRLMKLIPVLQQLLDDERIGVGHAELLARLKPEDQARVAGLEDVDPMSKDRPEYVDVGGLWESQGDTLDFDDDDAKREADPFHGMKAVGVRELEAYIARHVRLDLAHAAATAPLDFGPAAAAVATAEAREGRGRKVIAITLDSYVQPDARSEEERIYGPRSWKRADGSKGTTELGNGKRVDSPVCDHAITGVFKVGPHYGTAIPVCIAREKCQVHWKAEVAAKKANDKLRATGQGAKADAREKKATTSYEEQRRRDEAKRKAVHEEYSRLYPLVRDAIRATLTPALTRPVFELLSTRDHGGKAPKVTEDKFVEVLVMDLVEGEEPDKNGYGDEYNRRNLLKIASQLGVDTKPLERQVADAIKAEAKAAAAKTAPAKATKPATAPTGKKTAAKTARKKR